MLECDNQDTCPEGCPICSTCLTLIGCQSPVPRAGSSLSTTYILYTIAAAVTLLIIGLAIYHARRRSQQDDDLTKELMAGEMKGGNLYPSKPSVAKWEPPVNKPIQFFPNSKATTAGGAINDSDSEADESEASFDGTLPTVGETTVHMADDSTTAHVADDSTAPTIPTKEETVDIIDGDSYLEAETQCPQEETHQEETPQEETPQKTTARMADDSTTAQVADDSMPPAIPAKEETAERLDGGSYLAAEAQCPQEETPQETSQDSAFVDLNEKCATDIEGSLASDDQSIGSCD